VRQAAHVPDEGVALPTPSNDGDQDLVEYARLVGFVAALGVARFL
jgi:hypothetical protein